MSAQNIGRGAAQVPGSLAPPGIDDANRQDRSNRLTWLRVQPDRPLPILGARHLSQLEQLLGCLDVELPAAALDRLDRVGAVSKGYPHDFPGRLLRLREQRRGGRRLIPRIIEP